MEKGCSYVYYGAMASWHRHKFQCNNGRCSIPCANSKFCDPLQGTNKKCYGMCSRTRMLSPRTWYALSVDLISSSTSNCAETSGWDDATPMVPVEPAPFYNATNVIDATPYIGLLLVLLLAANLVCLFRRCCSRKVQQVQHAVLVKKTKMAQSDREQDELL